LTALLNPRDDKGKYKNPKYVCLKLEVLPKYCYVSDEFLFRASKTDPSFEEKYEETIVSVEDYIFGTYRLPVCLITSTILPECIKLLDGRMDSPVIYDNSEELYLRNLIERGQESCDDFNNLLLYLFFNKLSMYDKVKKTEDHKTGISVFTALESGNTYTFRIPDQKDIQMLKL
jgi:hypothetical protein